VALRLGAIIEALGGELQGDAALSIERLAPLSTAQPDAISFLSNPKYRKELADSRAGCVIVSPIMRDAAAERGAFIVAPDPYLYFARLTQLWKKAHAKPEAARIHPSAVEIRCRAACGRAQPRSSRATRRHVPSKVVNAAGTPTP